MVYAASHDFTAAVEIYVYKYIDTLAMQINCTPIPITLFALSPSQVL